MFSNTPVTMGTETQGKWGKIAITVESGEWVRGREFFVQLFTRVYTLRNIHSKEQQS